MLSRSGRDWPNWLSTPRLSGTMDLAGSPQAPQLRLRVGQPQQHVLGPWQAELRWQPGRLDLESFRSRDLQASGSLPLAIDAGGVRSGPLLARLRLDNLPLSRLNPLVGTTLLGQLSAEGLLRGSLKDPRPDLNIRLQAPGAGPLRLNETWRGSLRDRAVRLRPEQPAVDGDLQARLNHHWLPEQVDLRRGQGGVRLTGTPSDSAGRPRT